MEFGDQKTRVLIVDDYMESLAAMAALLDGPDRIILTARSGEEALRHLLHGEYAVVLLDVKMPGLDGYETAALIRARQKTRLLPIIFLTSNNKEVEHVARGYCEGAVDYIFKPVLPEMLRCKVNIFVELSKKTIALKQQNYELEHARKELAERADDLARSNKDLEQFAYVASHDLKEPLRMVSSYVKLLANRYKDRLDADANDFIEFAVRGVNRMERLINDVLAYSRVGSNKAFRPVNCDKVLHAAITRIEAVIRDCDAVVTYDRLPTVMGTETELIRLFQNLLHNAIKFRCEAAPRIHVSAARRRRPEDRGGEWLLAVRDNGIGIEPQYGDRIFQLFQRLHSEAEYEGSGVGLAICKRIVESHRGQIWVDSQLGKGATFYFTLPAVDTEQISTDDPQDAA